MTVPMMVLALLAIVAGYINTPWFGTFLGDWLLEGNPGTWRQSCRGTELDHDFGDSPFTAWYFSGLAHVREKVLVPRLAIKQNAACRKCVAKQILYR